MYFVSPTWKCGDCGEQIPTHDGIVNRDDHPECNSEKLARYQLEKAAWWEGYRFALDNFDDELVQADKREYGAGWRRIVADGIVIRTVED